MDDSCSEHLGRRGGTAKFVRHQVLGLATGPFAQAQCGTYNAQTNATGFISLTRLASNLRGHEAGPVKSHWKLYKTAQDDPDKNLGTTADRYVAAVATDSLFNMNLETIMGAAIETIKRLTGDDNLLAPADPQHDEAGNFWGYVNWAPYQPCR